MFLCLDIRYRADWLVSWIAHAQRIVIGWAPRVQSALR